MPQHAGTEIDRQRQTGRKGTETGKPTPEKIDAQGSTRSARKGTGTAMDRKRRDRRAGTRRERETDIRTKQDGNGRDQREYGAESARRASGTKRDKASLNSLPFTTPRRRRNNRPASNQLVSITQNNSRITATHHQTGISRRTLVILGLKDLGKLTVRAVLITIRIHDGLQDKTIIKIP